MIFVAWIFLLGGLGAAGPVIAHMLAKPRYKRVPFTMLRFLRVGQTESQSRRKVRDILILLLRCAIIVLIAMLFARPIVFTKREPEESRSVYYLGLDNSMSMAYSDGSGSYLSKLVDSAVDYIRSADDEGIFNICSLGSGRWASGLRKEQALAEVKRLRIAAASTNVSEFFSALKTSRESKYSGDRASVFVISDFTPNTLKQFVAVEEPTLVDNIDYKVVFSPKAINNAAVVDAGVSSFSEGKLVVNATVANYGEVEQQRKLMVEGGASKPVQIDIDLSAHQRRTYQLQIDAGLTGGEQLFLPVQLGLSSGDGLSEDDRFYLGVSLPRRKSVNALLVDEAGGEMFLFETAVSALSKRSSYETLQVRKVSVNGITTSDLEWADVVVFSAIADRAGDIGGDIASFIKAGGRAVFFATEAPSSRAAKLLWDKGVLAALPGRCYRERSYIEPNPCDYQGGGIDSVAARSLRNYRIDRITLTGFLECEPHSQSNCLWRLQNGFGFVYLKPLGSGSSVLVNTSVDDSLGSLTKSSASVAFCRYLLGRTSRVGEYSFSCDERVLLPGYDMETSSGERKQIWVETCDGRKRRAALADECLFVPNAGGIGWVRTLARPTRYAGVNLPEGETDMAKPVGEEVAKVMKRVFGRDESEETAVAEVLGERTRKPVWKTFAWIIILLLLVEPAVANRLKR